MLTTFRLVVDASNCPEGRVFQRHGQATAVRGVHARSGGARRASGDYDTGMGEVFGMLPERKAREESVVVAPELDTRPRRRRRYGKWTTTRATESSVV